MFEESSNAKKRHALVGPANAWLRRRRFQIDFLKKYGLQPHHRLIDLGCGTLRGGIPLIDYLEVGKYTGIESRGEVLDEGRKELTESGLEHKHPTLIHASAIADVNLAERADYIWAFSVLIHMTDEILNDAIAFMDRSLNAGGVFLGNVNVGPAINRVWGETGLPVVRRPWEFYKEAFGKRGFELVDLGSRTDFGDTTKSAKVYGSQDPARMVKAHRG